MRYVITFKSKKKGTMQIFGKIRPKYHSSFIPICREYPRYCQKYIFIEDIYNRIGVLDPKKVLFAINVYNFCHATSYSIHPLFPRLSLSPYALGILRQYHFWNSVTSRPLQMSKQFQTSFFCSLNNIVLDIHNFCKF